MDSPIADLDPRSPVVLADPGSVSALAGTFGDAVHLVSITDWLRNCRDSTVPATVGPVSGSDPGRASVIGAILPEGAPEETRSLLRELRIPVLDANSGTDIRRWLVAALADELCRSRTLAGDALRASARLRRDAMELHDTLAGIEAFLEQLGGPTFADALYLPPTADAISFPEPSAGASAQGEIEIELAQPLPIPLGGIAAFDLYLVEVPENSANPLRLAVSAAGEEIASVDVSWRDLSVGWNRVRLPWTCRTSAAQGEVVLTSALAAGDRAAFGLSSSMPLQRSQLRANASVPPGAALALRVWRGIAGTAVPPLAGASPRPRGTRTVLLMPSDCPRPALLSAPADREDFIHTDYWANENAVLVHGTVKGRVTAILRGISVENLHAVTASVHSAHWHSPVLGYHLAVVPAGVAPPEEPAGTWTTILPREWGEVHAFLEEPLSGEVDFLLSVMVANGAAKSNWSWGLFRGFRLHRTDAAGGT